MDRIIGWRSCIEGAAHIGAGSEQSRCAVAIELEGGGEETEEAVEPSLCYRKRHHVIGAKGFRGRCAQSSDENGAWCGEEGLHHVVEALARVEQPSARAEAEGESGGVGEELPERLELARDPRGGDPNVGVPATANNIDCLGLRLT